MSSAPKIGDRVCVEVKRRMIRRSGQTAEYIYAPQYPSISIVHDCRYSLAQTSAFIGRLFPLETDEDELSLKKDRLVYYITNDQYLCGKPGQF